MPYLAQSSRNRVSRRVRTSLYVRVSPSDEILELSDSFESEPNSRKTLNSSSLSKPDDPLP